MNQYYHIDGFITACETAKEESTHVDYFIYVIKKPDGYRIDFTGVVKADERIISTYHKGEKVL